MVFHRYILYKKIIDKFSQWNFFFGNTLHGFDSPIEYSTLFFFNYRGHCPLKKPYGTIAVNYKNNNKANLSNSGKFCFWGLSFSRATKSTMISRPCASRADRFHTADISEAGLQI